MTIEIPNYTLLKKLGAGAFAEVWLAEHQKNRRKAAVKILKTSVEAGAEAEALFLREGEVLASFSERNIVTIFDNAQVGDTAYLIMEYLAGGSLLDRMNQRGLEVGEAIGFVVQIAAALDAAHRQQIIHRDLKPANIMLRDETTPVLTDFGASRLLQRSTIYGKDGGVVGTPHYMSPEQITGQTLDGRSDLYGLGIMFHELLTGRVPYNGTVNEILALHLHGPLPQLPASLVVLQPVLDRLLAKQPAQRFATGAELADALRRCFLDQAALRQLVDFAPSSAWSSQLKALGFNLDTAERTEVRIAQGEFLQQSAAAQTRPIAAAVAEAKPQQAPRSPPLPPTPPLPGPVAPSPALPAAAAAAAALPAHVGQTEQYRPLSHWSQQAAALALALIMVLLAVVGSLQLNATMERCIVGALPAIWVLLAAQAWQGRSTRRWWWLALNSVVLLLCCAALFVSWNYLHGENRQDWNDWMWTLAASVLGAALLSMVALGLARRGWVSGVVGGVALGLAWVLAGLFGEEGTAGLLLVWLATLLTAGLWLWLVLSVPRQHPGPLSAHGRIGLMLLSLLLLVPVLLPMSNGVSQRWSAQTATRGEWFGLSPIGPVKVDFESAGAVVLYPQPTGQRPWMARWQIDEGWHGQSDVRLLLSETDDSVYSSSPAQSGGTEANATLQFSPSYFDLLSLKPQASPLPLRLQRFPPGNEVDFAGFDHPLAFNCDSGLVGTLRLNSDGTGELQMSPKDGSAAEARTLAWGYFATPEWDAGLVFVVQQPWPATLKMVSGELPQRGQFRELRYIPLGEYSKVSCALADLPQS